MPDNFVLWGPPDIESEEEGVDPNFAACIGFFVLGWGMLEQVLDNLFPMVFRIDPTQATCITANLGTKAKVEILQSAIHMVASLLPAEPVVAIYDGLNKTVEMSGKYRNLLAHGRPISARDSDGTEVDWMWGRFAARKQLSMLVPDTDADFWADRTEELYALSDNLFAASKVIEPILKAIPNEQWETACIIRDTKP